VRKLQGIKEESHSVRFLRILSRDEGSGFSEESRKEAKEREGKAGPGKIVLVF